MRHTTPNKDLETIDLDQLFDQIVETDLFNHLNDDTTAVDNSDDIAHLFELPQPNSSCSFQTSRLPNWDAEDAAWHKAITIGDQNPALCSSPTLEKSSSSTSIQVYSQSRGKGSLSEPELFNFDDLFDSITLDPRGFSQPSTPIPYSARPVRKSRPSPDPSFRRNRIHKLRNVSKNSTLSKIADKMLEPLHLRNGFQDLWSRKLDTSPEPFSLALPSNGLHSPPPSSKLIQDEAVDGFFPRDHAQPYTIAMSPPLDDGTTSPEFQQTNYHLTPLSSPVLDASSSRARNGNPFPYSHDGVSGPYLALSALQTPPQSHGLSSSAWGTDTSPTLEFSSFSASPEFNGPGKAEGWWNGATISQASTLHGNGYRTAHAHSRSASQNLVFSNGASTAGLGISCDSANFSSYDGDLRPAASNEADPSPFEMPAYTSIYAPASGIPIGTVPANPHRSSSRSPSPQPTFTRRRHSAHPSHSNRTSINTSTATSHRRKSSNSSTGSRTASLCAGANGGGGGGGFVNFTPSDSRKILTGVAPSGSSKTKARREKEAADKRRKLSQAAVRAVVEAGGDLGRLEKEIEVLEG
jgi:hypothetical protein